MSNQKTVTVLCDAYSTSENGDGPSYAVYEVSQKFIERLEELQRLCDTADLTEVRTVGYPDEWGPGNIDDEERLQNGELVVSGNTFWFTDYPKYGQSTIETHICITSVLKKAFDANPDGALVNLAANQEAILELYNDKIASHDKGAPK